MMPLTRPAEIPCQHVADIELPQELVRLYDLAYNLWWAWTPRAREIFAAIDPQAWAHYRNPVQLLINVEPRQWRPLLEWLDPIPQALEAWRKVTGHGKDQLMGLAMHAVIAQDESDEEFRPRFPLRFEDS